MGEEARNAAAEAAGAAVGAAAAAAGSSGECLARLRCGAWVTAVLDRHG